MQLGTRWAAGSTPPARLGSEWLAAIAAAEAEDCGTGSWTLTWLEGYPRIVHDSGRELGLGGTPLDNDDW